MRKPSFLLLFTLSFSLLTCFFLVKKFTWTGPDGKGYTRIIDSDGKGYYSYLPSIFINKNSEAQKIDNRYIYSIHGRGVNKYFIGTAVAMFPFFCSGYVIAYFKGHPLDGYSPPFQRSVSIGALFYLVLGLFFFWQFLGLYSIREEIITFSVLLILFGTNLLSAAVLMPSFSHIYSFCFISAFLFFTKKHFVRGHVNHLVVLSFIFGMIILIRPVNGLILVVVPFLAGNSRSLKTGIEELKKPKLILLCLLVIFILLSIQFLVWHEECGEFFVWSYSGEGFNFFHPEILNVLFSFRKGLLIYSPLLLITIPGLVLFFRKNKFEFYSLIFFLIILIYVISCWWEWTYGPSFGQRPFIEFYAIAGLLMALSISETRSFISRFLLWIPAGAFLLLNLFQTYQYQQNIIHPSNMNFKKYLYVFLRSGSEFSGCIGGENDIKPFGSATSLLANAKAGFEKPIEFIHSGFTRTDSLTHSVFCDFSDREFNTVFEFHNNIPSLPPGKLFSTVSFDWLKLAPIGCEGPLMVVDLSDSTGKNYYYHTSPVQEIPGNETGKWNAVHYNIRIPEWRNSGDVLKVYPWNLRRQSFYLDNFEVQLVSIR